MCVVVRMTANTKDGSILVLVSFGENVRINIKNVFISIMIETYKVKIGRE